MQTSYVFPTVSIKQVDLGLQRNQNDPTSGQPGRLTANKKVKSTERALTRF